MKKRDIIIDDPSVLDSAESFYKYFIKEYHRLAKDQDLAKNGIINIPKLREIGVDVILDMLDDQSLRQQFIMDLNKYYSVIGYLTIAFAVYISKYWQDDINAIYDHKIDFNVDIFAKADGILRNEKHFTQEQIDWIFNAMPSMWNGMMVPIWEKEKIEPYVAASFIMMFQVVMSIMLEDFR